MEGCVMIEVISGLIILVCLSLMMRLVGIYGLIIGLGAIALVLNRGV